MRIALVSPYDLSVPGGVQSQIVGLSEALVRLGHDLCVVGPGRTGSWGIPGAESVAVGSSLPIPANGSLAPITPWPLAMRRSVRALTRFSPQVVHVHEPLVPGPALASLISAEAPVVATFHRARPSRTYSAYARPLRRVVHRATELVAVSDAAAETARRVLGEVDLTIVANAVDSERFERLHPSRRSSPTALFVGRIERRKGLEVLLAAFHGLAGDFSLRVVGDGPEAAQLKRRFGSDNRIVFL
ncbi:MAG: glycosyltransferase family 4 protein, partial [Acidimicrobiales bacterium]